MVGNVVHDHARAELDVVGRACSGGAQERATACMGLRRKEASAPRPAGDVMYAPRWSSDSAPGCMRMHVASPSPSPSQPSPQSLRAALTEQWVRHDTLPQPAQWLPCDANSTMPMEIIA
jgi:hypothetical protein